VQAGSPIGPVCAEAEADASVKATVRKSASGRGVHPTRQNDGASAIHSAEETSMPLAVVCVVYALPVLRSWMATVMVVSCTLSWALMVSPGAIVMGSSIGLAGTGISSYQAE